ncbi:N-glycosylase/DNA lyase [bacterium]|nr:N-glycosylase/DNA lyase [bacterium]
MIKELKKIYSGIKPVIVKRLQEFDRNYKKGNEKYVFGELAFCILTPQSKAKSCFKALTDLIENGILYNGTPEEIEPFIRSVRFLKRKSQYLVIAREQFTKKGSIKIKDFIESFSDVFELRQWIVDNVKGIGYKESGHFIRNIGKGQKVTILDRHILKNLLKYNVIDEIPKTLTKKNYLEIEKLMLEFSKKINIPADHLDLLFWYLEAGEVFK